MKPEVDNERCIGCGLCVEICPSIFLLLPEMTVSVIGQADDEDTQERLDAARAYCPVEAIL